MAIRMCIRVAACHAQGEFAAGRARYQQQEEGVLVAMRMVLGLAGAPALPNLPCALISV